MLVDGDRVVTELVAIVLYLAEKYPDRKRIPAALGERAECYRWLSFAATELEQPLWRIARNTRIYPEAERQPSDGPRLEAYVGRMYARPKAAMRIVS